MAALLAEGGPASLKRRSELQLAPAFPAAVRETAAGLAALYQGNRLLNRIVSDRGRFFASLFVLDLHFRRHDDGIGLTPGRLKAMCVEQGVCSATRAGALLALMQLGGYVERAPGSGDRRRRQLAPTAKLIAQQRARWRCHFSAAAPLLADAGRALAALDRPELAHGLVRLISAYYRAGFRFTDHIPALRLFSGRDGGLFVLFALLAATEPGDLERQSPIPISISGLARGITSSRVHILKLLKDAEAEGLLERPHAGSVVLMPSLTRGLYDFFALSYLLLTHFAKTTLDHFEAAEPDNVRR